MKLRRHALTSLFALLVLAVALLCGCSAAGSAESAHFTETELELFSAREGTPETVAVRFYDETPNVPYIGFAQYLKLVFQEEVQVDVQGSTVTITSADGGTATVDTAANTISSADWARFRHYMEPMQRGELVGFIDFAAPFVRINTVEYENEPQEVVFDLGSYGIELYADDEDAYLPLATCADLMADEAMNALSYNGEVLVLTNGYPSEAQDICPDYYTPIYEDVPREQDMIDYSYAELCFCYDVLRGNTGVGVIDRAIARDGLDETLQTFDEVTSQTRDLLLSEDKADYVTGLEMLSYLTMDMHSMAMDTNVYSYASGELSNRMTERMNPLLTEFRRAEYFDYVANLLDRGAAVENERSSAWGDETYHEYDDTAVITLDSFMDYDEEGWQEHYENGAPIPTGEDVPDMVGQLVAGLERAKANPKIRNVIIDLSCNTGGSSDVLAGIIAILTGTADLHCHDLTTDQYYHVIYDVDTAFDGSFDTGAAARGYDFNYAILTSVDSFSCGNLLPSLAYTAGIPIIGERSGGGSCSVARMYLPDGQAAQIGTAYSMCVDEDGISIESGVPVEVELVGQNEYGRPDYARMFDLEVLDATMDELYADGTAQAA